MRPIGAPDHPVGEAFDQRAAERNDVVIRRPRDRHALRAGRLDPEILVPVHQPVKSLVLRMIDAFLDVGRAHVVDHDRRRQRGEKILKFGQIVHLEIDHDMPAELVHPRGDALEHVARREIDQPLEKIKAHAAHAGLVHPFELVVGHFLADKGDALGAARGRLRAHRPSRDCPWSGRTPARSRSCRSRENRAARTASPSARRRACICAPAHREICSPDRTRGNAHRPRPAAALNFGFDGLG